VTRKGRAQRRAEPPPSGRAWRWWHTALLAAALVVATCLVYAPVRHYDFVEIDDPLYVRENPHLADGLSLENVRWAFTSEYAAYWIPLTWISYMGDVEVYGRVDPGGHHLTNLVLHLANTLLLFGLLRRTTRAPVRSAFVAALFALHPLHVESVAWITERKDVLSTLFWFLGLWAYAWYAARPGWRRYLPIVACVVLGLLSKPMLVTFPFVLLLMDIWPLRRARDGGASGWEAWRPLLLEKVPLLALVVAASVVTYVAQAGFGAAPSLASVPFGLRFANAIVSYATYLWMMVWPSPLTVIYPLPASVPVAQLAGASVVLAAVTAFALWGARRWPYLPVGWFWYLGTMVPVIGVVQVGVQARADRFTYVPLVGVFLMLVWACADAAAASRSRRVALAAAGLLVVGASGVQAHRQLSYWRDSVTVWTHAVESTFGVTQFDAHRSLGRILAGQGRTAEALGHFDAAVAIDPSSAEARLDLARILSEAGRPAEAARHLEQVTRADPGMIEAHIELAVLLSNAGQEDAAIREYEAALKVKPDRGDVHNNLGTLLARQERISEALSHFEQAARLGPDFETARVNMGVALARLGRVAEARSVFVQVLQQNPRNETARRSIAELSGR
jgi:protein O-mannosyl-transferase